MSTIFAGALMTATLSLFRLLGRTPPPSRWPSAVMATCVMTHLAYVVAVATVDDQPRQLQVESTATDNAGTGDR